MVCCVHRLRKDPAGGLFVLALAKRPSVASVFSVGANFLVRNRAAAEVIGFRRVNDRVTRISASARLSYSINRKYLLRAEIVGTAGRCANGNDGIARDLSCRDNAHRGCGAPRAS